MKERPILFKGRLVRRILANAKTQTRRIADVDRVCARMLEAGGRFVGKAGSGWGGIVLEEGGGTTSVPIRAKYGAPGDRLWVRETHARFHVGEGLDRPVPECVAYRATCDDGSFDYVNTRGEVMGLKVTKWTPSIFMPRWASRITLNVTDVRLERLSAISREDVVAEGVDPSEVDDPAMLVPRFRELWESVNCPASWTENPWVWCVEFKRIEQARSEAA